MKMFGGAIALVLRYMKLEKVPKKQTHIFFTILVLSCVLLGRCYCFKNLHLMSKTTYPFDSCYENGECSKKLNFYLYRKIHRLHLRIKYYIVVAKMTKFFERFG